MITDWFTRWSSYLPSKVALREVGAEVSYNFLEINRAGNALTAYFRAQGITKGDRIMMLADFHAEYILLLPVAQKSGIILVPVNFRLAPREIDFLISNAEPKLVIVEDKYRSLLTNISTSTKVMSWSEFASRAYDATSSDVPVSCEQLDENDPAFILYTSGTTGFPKGSLYTHGMMAWNSFNTSMRLKITSDDRTLMVMPPFHTGGWNVLTTPILHFGGTVVLMNKFDGKRALQLLEEEKITVFMAVPTMLKMMMEADNFETADLSSLRFFIVGGEALPIPVIERWASKGILIRQGYGLTEVGTNVTSLEANDAIRKRGSIGFPNFYIETRIVKEDGEEARSNESGELWLKGPVVTPGYWQNDEATNKAIVDGWFKTGDVVKRDEEGYLYVVDRIKNMYISGGENVYPAEVEKYLLTHPLISEAAVIGISDQRWGEVGKAYIVLKPGATLLPEQLADFCQHGLAKFKIPKYFTFIAALPKNDTGKIDRKNLVNLA